MIATPNLFDTQKWQGLTTAARGVLLYFYVRSDKCGVCYPSINRIAQDLKLDRKTVIRVVRELSNNEIIVRNCNPGKHSVYKIKQVPNGTPVPNHTPVGRMNLTGVQNGTTPVPNGTPEHIQENFNTTFKKKQKDVMLLPLSKENH